MKRNKEFDRSIREKMENLAPGFNADSWDKLQHQLDSEDAQSEWDEQFSKRLRQIERPYNRASWQALAERLDLEEMWLNSIYSAKAKELLFMALVFWSVIQFLPIAPQHIALQAPLQNRETRLLPANTGDKMVSPEDINASIGAAIIHPPAKTSSAESFKPVQEQAEQVSTTGTYLLPSFVTTPLLNGYLNTNGSFITFGDPLSSESYASETPGNNLQTDYLRGVQAPVFPEENEAPAQIAEVSLIPSKNLARLLPEGEWVGEKALLQHPVPRKKFVRIGMMGASDYNRIITPPVRVNTEIVSLDRYALGYSGGITIGFESGRWEVETGFIYTAKRYYPLQVLYVEGSLKDGIFGSGIKQTEFDIMQVPLNFRYNFLSRNRWRIYGLVGASVHIVAQANYYVADIEDFETATFRPPPSDGSRAGQERPQVVVTQQAQSQGWLEGGGLLENSYAGLNVGAGIERYMSPRWSLFAQPTYYHSLLYANKGLGPVNDRIHTMSLFMGVKVRL